MTATKLPNQDPPTNAPTVTKTWSPNNGEGETKEWAGTAGDMESKYEAEKALGEAGANIAELTYINSSGRARLVMKLGRQGNQVPGYPADVTIIEELYAVDVEKDMRCAGYFCTDVDVGKGLPLTDDQVSWVTECVDLNYSEAEITEYARAGKVVWASWSTGMKELRWHMSHGADTFFETAFILRRSLYGVSTSFIKASFTGINTVVTAPSFVSKMDALIGSLPTGEWLYKPPQADYMGRGKWRITQEWWWAVKWSVVYGGTWNMP